MDAVRYVVDPSDPRAPPQEVWDRLDEEARRRVVASLPSDFPSATPPEGDWHRIPKHSALDSMDEHYRRIRRRIYLSSELPVYYPNEPVFAPDLLAVLDVENHKRQSWVVGAEGKGLDFVLEIHVSGSKHKDFEENVDKYARLCIPEYFAYDVPHGLVRGWRLRPGAATYEPIVPQGGRWHSAVLGLDLSVEEERLRFYHGSAVLLDSRELVRKLEAMVDQAVARADQEAQRAEQQAGRAEEQARRAERYARRLRELGIDPDSIDDSE